MRGLRLLTMILLAAVFAVSGPLRALPCHAETAPPPCHETVQDMTGDMAGMAHDKAPPHKSKPDAVAMNCCAGCLPAGVRGVDPAGALDGAVRIAFTPLDQAFEGLSPAPDHDPPRPFA